MNTARDALVIDSDKTRLTSRVAQLANKDVEPQHTAATLGLRSTGWWNATEAILAIRNTPAWESLIIPCLYRPFDKRWLFNHPAIIDRPRSEANRHMLRDNLSLVTTRQTKEPFAALATQMLCGQHKIAAVYDRSYFFPLYLYPEDKRHLFHEEELPSSAPGGRRPNLSPEFIADFSAKLGLEFIPDGKGDRQATFGPEDVFSYMYAVFHSPTYRSRYAEFLKIDFPRLPLTSNADLFRELCALGDDLVALHLMTEQGSHLPGYPVEGSNTVEIVRYSEPTPAGGLGRVWINKTQYFDDVKPEVWEFHVGGYQVCEKWLKDRKGRTLTYDDLSHYQRVVAALEDTISLMARIDEAIEEHGGFPI